MSDRHRYDMSFPLAEWMRFTAIDALRNGELRAALRADAMGLKSIELPPTLSALPEFADRGRGLAGRTGISGVTRQLCEAR